MIQPPYKPGEPIPTARLPRRCPACGRQDIAATLLSGSLVSSVHRVTCGCGWSERYQMQQES